MADGASDQKFPDLQHRSNSESSEEVLRDLVSDVGNGIEHTRDGNGTFASSGFTGKPRRSSILSKSASRPRQVKKSVSFCSMPEDRRVCNGKSQFSMLTNNYVASFFVFGL